MYTDTQVSVVLMGLEEFVGSVEQEFEWQEDFHVGSLLQQALVNGLGVFQLVHANSVGPGPIADGVQWVHHLSKREKRIRSESSRYLDFQLREQFFLKIFRSIHKRKLVEMHVKRHVQTRLQIITFIFSFILL